MTPTTKSALWIIGILVVLIAASAYFMRDSDTVENIDNNGETVVCTMDAKMCPDGSYVGRVAPNCQFAACPASTSTSVNVNGDLYPADIFK